MGSGSGIWLLAIPGRLIATCRAARRIGPLVVVAQIRRADFLLAALLADDVDQIRSTQSDFLIKAELIQLLQVIANHGCLPADFP